MDLKLNFKNWTLRQYASFTDAAKEGDFKAIITLLSKAVESWSFPGDPHDPEYWLDTLNLHDWQEIMKRVTETLTAELNPKV